jgi:hypothetical protein
MRFIEGLREDIRAVVIIQQPVDLDATVASRCFRRKWRMVYDGIVLADSSPTPARASPSRAFRFLSLRHQQKVSELLA